MTAAKRRRLAHQLVGLVQHPYNLRDHLPKLPALSFHICGSKEPLRGRLQLEETLVEQSRELLCPRLDLPPAVADQPLAFRRHALPPPCTLPRDERTMPCIA